ncbi:O-acyltransferase [Temnothorax longispinosus]|uniref:O-acyltransferase n=2 Tax=Formicidae TaxID=36668 RepID=A0A4S2KEF0_9HYME|nr:O-acyltransferase [Temnothorax longispinosus]
MTAEHEHSDSRVRSRRTKSVTRAEEIQKAEQKVRRSQPDKPCHRPRDSLFSWSSGFDNFTGFVNWGFLLLGIGGIRLLLENFIKYGIRVDPWQWFLFLSGKDENGGEEYPSLLLICYSTVPVGLCLLIEKGLSVDIVAHGTGMVFHVINLVVMVLMPMVVIHVKDSGFSLVGAMYVCMLYATLFLKLWSYVQVNMWCRLSSQKKTTQGRMRRQLSYTSGIQQSANDVIEFEHEMNDRGNALVQYPDNLNFGDLYYYILAPTLCYELNFPRTQRIRKRFLIKRILEVVVGCQMMMSLFQQWMIPSVKNSLIPFSNMDVAKASELVEMGYGKTTASVTVFFISAFFHEYLVSVPLKTFKIWAFMGMMGQIPLSVLSKMAERYCGARWGNIVVWASLIIGQPLCIMMYYHDYVVTHFGETLIEDYSVIPNHLIWLCFFYLIFHSFLNLLGELLHFADRNFYNDWWNANNIDTFWRTWNMPVHRWAVRHLYIPVVEMGYGKTTASVTVFFISAFFHEYLVSVPLKTFKIWAFMGMMGQIPLSVLSKMAERYCGARWGNIVVWASLIIGQPLCIMMYYHDYVVTHFGETLIEDYSVVISSVRKNYLINFL